MEALTLYILMFLGGITVASIFFAWLSWLLKFGEESIMYVAIAFLSLMIFVLVFLCSN